MGTLASAPLTLQHTEMRIQLKLFFGNDLNWIGMGCAEQMRVCPAQPNLATLFSGLSIVMKPIFVGFVMLHPSQKDTGDSLPFAPEKC